MKINETTERGIKMKYEHVADRLKRLMHKTIFKFNILTHPMIKLSDIDLIGKILSTPYKLEYFASSHLHATERIVVKSLMKDQNEFKQ